MNLKTESDSYDSYDTCNLKPVDMNEWEIICAADIIEYAKSRGFCDIAHIMKNSSGKLYKKIGSSIYVCADNKDIKRYRVKNLESGKNAAVILARFHNATEGFSREAVKVNVFWGRRMSRMKKMTSCLEDYLCYLEDKKQYTDFERLTRGFIDDFVSRAESSVKILTSKGSLMRLEESMRLKEVCINNISANTFACNDRLIIKDIYHFGYNMVEEDIALLANKVIECTKCADSFDEIIKSYKTVRKLNSDSVDIIRALVSFPAESIKTITRYYRCPCDDKKFIEKFLRYSSKEKFTNILEV